MEVRAGIVIRAAAHIVFAIIATPERLPAWNDSVEWAGRLTAGPVGVGSRARMRGRLVGQSLESETEVIAFFPPSRFATRATRGPRLETQFTVEPVSGGAHVLVEARGQVPGGKLGNLVAERLLRTELQRSLQRLRLLCEDEARRQPAAPNAGGPTVTPS